MEFNIDEYKITGKKIYINGWAHSDNYKIKVTSGEEIKEVKNYESRYDINKLFHEKIQDNNYGFKEEIEFTKTIKTVKVILETKNEESVLLVVNNSKIAKTLKKVRKILGKIKRGIKFLWREYHFLVPPAMMKKYVKDFFGKSEKERMYDPSINSEYNTWYENRYSLMSKASKLNILTLTNKDKKADIIINDNNFGKKIKTIKDKYVCLIDGEVEFNLNVVSKVEDILDDDYDLIYFDNDNIKDKKYEKPNFKPDWSRDTLLGVNYIGNCFIIKTDILKKMKVKEWNCYHILLNLINMNVKVKHISEIVYHDKNEIHNEIDTLEKYLKENKINAKSM